MSISFYQLPSSQEIFWHLEKDPLVAIIRENPQITHEISNLFDQKFVSETLLKEKIEKIVKINFKSVPYEISQIYTDHLYTSIKECATYRVVFEKSIFLRSKL